MVVRGSDGHRLHTGGVDPVRVSPNGGPPGAYGLNSLKQNLRRRSSIGKKEIEERTGRTAYANALEQALERLGEINWDGVQAMASLVQNRAVPAEEALSLVKPYMKSSSPFVVLKALTIIDALAINCPEVHPRLAGKKWTTRVLRIASSTDKKIYSAVAQLCVNWVQKYRSDELGIVYQSVLQELESRNITLPTPLDSRSPTPEFLKHLSSREMPHSSDSSTSSLGGGFERGLDFCQLLTDRSPPPAPRTPTMQQSKAFTARTGNGVAMTVQRIKADVQSLGLAMAKVTDTAQAMKRGKGGIRKDVLDQLNMAWVAAEKCNVWLEDIQELLAQEIDQDEVAMLLDVNDVLNAGLERWQALVSLGVGDMGSADEEEGTQLLHDIGHMPWHRASPSGYSDYSDFQMRQLKDQNESLRRGASEAEAAQQAAVAEARAEAQKELHCVKGKAVRRIKELMTQVEELNCDNKELQRGKEMLALQLESTRADLERDLKRNDETQRLQDELNEAQASLEANIAQSAKTEEELHGERKRLRNLVSELEAQLEERASELDLTKAEANANAAKANAQIEKLTNMVEKLKANEEQVEEFKQRAEEAEKMMVTLKLELGRESILRKKAHNQIREMKGNVCVLARVRPPVVAGLEGTPEVALKTSDAYTLELKVEKKSRRSLSFTQTEFVTNKFEFDGVFGPEATQAEIYHETSQLIQSAFDGYNVCIFCYGQTGSGKTYTISGEEGQPGIIPRAIEEIFVPHGNSETTMVRASMIELYQDSLYDLFTGCETQKLRIKLDAKTGLVNVEGAATREAKDANELLVMFEEGQRKRRTAATKLNIQSSRSHLIFRIVLERTNAVAGSVARANVSFVDLAGSERVMRSGALDDRHRMNEAKAINKSLSALGDVVSALTTGESFIPYRNHKLTELMRDSLGGNAKTLMIVNVSPLCDDAGEARNSLDYATRVKQVTNEASRSFETREIARLKAIVEKQAAEIRAFKAQKKEKEKEKEKA